MKAEHMFLLVPILGASFSLPAYAEREIQVSFTEAKLVVVDNKVEPILETPVVLPKANFYSLPATGTVVRAEMGPSWTPTPTMHRTKPGKYKGYYAPYENGNAMGHCKLTIRFDGDDPALQHVRVHGAIHMDNVLIFKDTHHLGYHVGLTNVRKEFISKPFS